jgi:rubrerythrin
MQIRLVPAYRGRRYECFECGLEIIAAHSMDECPNCDEPDNFWVMD